MTKHEIAVSALEDFASRYHDPVSVQLIARDALTAICAAPVTCGHLQSGDYFENADGCRVCAAPVETLSKEERAVAYDAICMTDEDAPCSVMARAACDAIDAYRAGKR